MPHLRKIILISFVLIFPTSIFYGFYTENIPFEVEETMTDAWHASVSIPWPKMAVNLFKPISDKFIGEPDVMTSSGRVTECAIWKLLSIFTGDSMQAMQIYNVMVAVIFFLLALFFGWFISGNGWASLLLSFFLITTPAYGWTILEYGDFAPLDQALMLAYFLGFIRIFTNLRNKPSYAQSGSYYSALFILWFVGILAIKAKDPGKFLVPGLSWLCVLFHPGFNFLKISRETQKNFFPLIVVLIYLTLPLFLVTHRSGDLFFDSSSMLRNPFYMFFYNPFGWVSEKVPCLFEMRRSLPVSILSNFGFFMSWAFILCGMFLMGRRDSSQSRPFSFAFFLLFWTLMSLGFYAFHSCLIYTRYLVWGLLPFTYCVAFVWVRALEKCPHFLKPWLTGTLVLLSLVKIGDNALHSMYLRGELEQIWTPKWIFLTEIVKDQKNRKEVRLFDVDKTWNPKNDFARRIQPYLIADNERVDVDGDKVFEAILQQYGVAYLASNRPLDLPWEIKLLKTVKTAELSKLTMLRNRFLQRSGKIFYLYRVSLASSALPEYVLNP